MSDLTEATLSSLVYANKPITYGIVQPGPDISPEGIPLIRGKDYSSGKVDSSSLYHVLPEIDRPYARSKVQGGDLLLSIVGYVGQVAQVPDELSGANITQTTARISIDPSLANNDFIFQYLSSPYFRAEITRYEKGSAQPGLNLSDVARLRVKLLPLGEQQRVSKILSKLDVTIEQTGALIAKMQQVKVGLMHDLFTRGVTPDGRLRPTREQAPDIYKESPLGLIPKEWDAGRLDHYLDPTSGIKPGPFGSSLTKDNYVSSGFRVYGQEQVIAGTLEIGDYFISEAKFLEMSGFEVLADDVLISLVGTVGCVLVAKPPFERGIINPRLMRLRPARGVVVISFLKHLLLSANVRRQIDILAGGGTMPVINGKIIRRLAIPILPYDEQVRVAERIDVIDTSLESSAEELAKLHQQKHGLMYDLLTGRVRVH